MADEAPWRSDAELRSLLASWRQRLAGLDVGRVAGGPGWLLLTMGGPNRPPIHLFFAARPGAVMLWDDASPPPPPYLAALERQPRHPLAQRLAGARLRDAGLLPADRAVALVLVPRDGPDVRLVHQLFGSRGNLLLVAADGRLLWSSHPGPPPSLLAAPAPAASPAPADIRAPGGTARLGTGADEPDPAAAFRAAGLARLAAHLEAELTTRGARAVRRAEEAAARLREKLARELAEADRGDDLRRLAEALAAHLSVVERGVAEAVVPDPAGGSPLTIPLDPARSPAANLEEYFRRARKAARGRDLIARRLEECGGRLAALAAARAALTAVGAQPAQRLEAYLAWRRDHAALLGGPGRGAGPGEAPEPARPFRRYRIEGRWEVWIGRDNAENDELTHRAAAPADIWLHAQGVPGSHVILRTGGHPEAVPRRVLEKAAALAALHSRARHSALVPVMHTLRKHVRKPRRSPPGTAACSREKTIFVAPGVPGGTEPA